MSYSKERKKRIKRVWDRERFFKDQLLKERISLLEQKRDDTGLTDFSSIATLEMIEDNPKLYWNWHDVSSSPFISIHQIFETRSKFLWHWPNVAKREDLTMNLVMEWKKIIRWDRRYLSSNPNLTLDMIINDRLGEDGKGKWYYIEDHKCIPFKFIEENPEFFNDPDIMEYPFSSKDYIRICSNPNITEKDLKKYMIFYKSRFPRCYSSNISWKFIKKYCAHNWKWDKVIEKEEMTWSKIKRELIPLMKRNKERNYYLENCLPFESAAALKNSRIVLDNPLSPHGDPWDYEILSQNRKIEEDLIWERRNMDWNWDELSYNYNLPLKFILRLEEKDWYWEEVLTSKLRFMKEIETEIINNRRRHLAAFLIQEWWRNIQTNEKHPVGRKKIKLDIEGYHNDSI
jgi:hypothetical protein